ncbi:MAG: site-specific integrase, partial [Acidimicrobiales bacterium]|nr:site-specific integrase [Acidimicrobiales bacterium]
RLGDERVRRLTARQLDLAYSSMAADGAGPATTRVAHTILRSMLTQAVRWGPIPANPAAHARPPHEHHSPIEPPDPAAVTKVLASIDADPQLAAFVRLAATTGCRRSELCALRWDDIDLERGSMLVARALDGAGGIRTTKTGRAKAMALDPATVVAVTRWRSTLTELALAVRAGTPEWVFPADRDLTRPVNPSVMSHRWSRAAKAEGLEGVRLHDLRHFMASRMLAAGVAVRTVANRLGHSNPATTLRVYAHLIPAADRAAADDLGALLDRQGGTV